jgi:hypothetical protein
MRFQFHLQSLIRFAVDISLFGNLWIAFMSVATVWQASLVLGLSVPPDLFALAFAATFGYYNLDRLIEQKPKGVLIQARHIWIKKYAKGLFVLSFAAAGWAAYLLYNMPFRIQALMMLLVFIAFLYSLAIPIGNKKWSLKQTGLLKPMLIAFVWVSISFLFIPIYHQNLSDSVWPLSLGYGLFITALCLPFDYRDRFIDRNNSMSICGIAGSVSRVSQLIGLLLFGQLAIWASVIPYDFLLFMFPFQCFAVFVCYKSMQLEKEWLYSFGIDGLILGQALVCWIYLHVS